MTALEHVRRIIRLTEAQLRARQQGSQASPSTAIGESASPTTKPTPASDTTLVNPDALLRKSPLKGERLRKPIRQAR